MKRMIYLVVAALVPFVVIVSSAAAQGENAQQALEKAQERVQQAQGYVESPEGQKALEQAQEDLQQAKNEVQQAAQQFQKVREGEMEATSTIERTAQGLPQSGGASVGSVLLPAAALLIGSGVLAYAVLRSRR